MLKLFPGSWQFYAIGAGAILIAGLGFKAGEAWQSRETSKARAELIANQQAEITAKNAAILHAERNAGALRQALETMKGRNAALSADLEAARNQSPEIIIREVESDNAAHAPDNACLYEPVSDGLRRATEARREGYR